MQDDDTSPDLEREREELLAKISASLSPAARQALSTAKSDVESPSSVTIEVSKIGTSNADV